MAKTVNNLAWRMRVRQERSSAGLVAKWGQKIAKRPDTKGKLAGQYKLGISTVRQNMTREREAKRRAKLQADWGQHADAILALATAKHRSRHMIHLVSSNDARAELDAADRARRERTRVMLGAQWEATHVTYARLALGPSKDKDGKTVPERERGIVKAYHRTPQLGGHAKARWTNRRDVWACYQVA